MITWAYVALSKVRDVEEMLFLFAMGADVAIIFLIVAAITEILKCQP